MTHAYRLCFNVLCTCLVLRHDQQRRRVNFLPKWLSSSILGWLGQNFERPSKKIRHLGRHILLKIHEPGGTKLKNLQYKKIFVVKNRKCANSPVLTIVSIGRRKSPAGTKNKTLETWMRTRIGIFRILTSHIQWHKLELMHEERAIFASIAIPIDGCTKREYRLRRHFTEKIFSCPRIAGNGTFYHLIMSV